MYLGVVQLPLQSDHVVLDLILGPPQNDSPKVIDVSFKIRLPCQLHPDAFLPFLLVLWPSTDGYLDVFDDNIHEAYLLHSFSVQVILNDAESLPKPDSAFTEHLSPLLKSAVLFHGPIVAVKIDRGCEIFDITTRVATTESLGIEILPVLHATNQVTGVNIVECVVGPGPLLVAVVNFELDIGRNPRRLNGRDIGANHFSIGKFIGEIDGPDACAGSDVNGLLNRLLDRGEE